MNEDTSSELPPEWQDFEVRPADPTTTSADLYRRFLEFKKSFSKLPKNELIKRGWIESSSDIGSLTNFFMDYSGSSWNGLFRKSQNTNEILVSLWLSKAKEYSERMVVNQNYPAHQSLTKDDLRNIAKLSPDPLVIRELPAILKPFGISLVFVPSLPGLKLDGAVFEVFTNFPAIGMSIRYSRLDYFWFTLMHELAHVVLHSEMLKNPILDDLESDAVEAIEIQANRLAKSSFIDRHLWRNCPPKYEKSVDAIHKFAKENKLHPAIVAGLLRKEEGNYAAYSKIVNEINTRDILFSDD